MIRRWGACNHQFINIKRSVRRGAIVAKPISPRQTGRRFMCALAYPYGVTRRGMTQRISASLLPLDGWSRPNVTAACLIHERKLVWALCSVSIDGGDLLEMSKISRLRPGVARRRFPVTFGCSIECKKDEWRRHVLDVREIYIWHVLRLICFSAVITFNSVITRSSRKNDTDLSSRVVPVYFKILIAHI